MAATTAAAAATTNEASISGVSSSKPKVKITEVAEKFVTNYYKIFSSNRAELSSLYHETLCLSFEGQGYQGTQKIMNKLNNLPIKKIKHDSKTIDVQVLCLSHIFLHIPKKNRKKKWFGIILWKWFDKHAIDKENTFSSND